MLGSPRNSLVQVFQGLHVTDSSARGQGGDAAGKVGVGVLLWAAVSGRAVPLPPLDVASFFFKQKNQQSPRGRSAKHLTCKPSHALCG